MLFSGFGAEFSPYRSRAHIQRKTRKCSFLFLDTGRSLFSVLNAERPRRQGQVRWQHPLGCPQLRFPLLVVQLARLPRPPGPDPVPGSPRLFAVPYSSLSTSEPCATWCSAASPDLNGARRLSPRLRRWGDCESAATAAGLILNLALSVVCSASWFCVAWLYRNSGSGGGSSSSNRKDQTAGNILRMNFDGFSDPVSSSVRSLVGAVVDHSLRRSLLRAW